MLGRIEEAEEEESSDSDSSSSCSDDLEEAAIEMDDRVSAMGEEESSAADDERSDDESDCSDDGIEERQDSDEDGDEISTSPEEISISYPFSRRLTSPIGTESPTGLASQGTPEVCEEDDSRFFDYDDHCIDIIDKVLAIDASTASEMAPSPGSKRILSSLFSDDDDDTGSDFNDTPKRMRCTVSSRSPNQSMTSLFLGPSAYDAATLERQRESMVSPFSEEEQDRQLSEELEETDLLNDRDSTPVPLLSPPPSPLCVQSDRGQLTTVCEWPSNLAIDSALNMITGLRAHSPASLVRLDLEEEDRMVAYYEGTTGGGTSLTPLLQGIRVNLD